MKNKENENFNVCIIDKINKRREFMYPLPKAFSVHINGDHDNVSRYKAYSLKKNWVE